MINSGRKCGRARRADAVRALLGGSPTQVPWRYTAADPAPLVPAAPVVLVHSVHDDVVPVTVARSYATAVGARAAGADVRVDVRVDVRLDEQPVGHFAVIDPARQPGRPCWRPSRRNSATSR